MKELDKKNIEDILSLTPMQEGMLFHYLKDRQSDLYFEQLSLGISGEIDIEIFEKAWHLVVETNEMLRTVFRWEKVNQPVQMVLKEHRLNLEYHDLSTGPWSEEITDLKDRDRKEKFDLRIVPFRLTLCKTGEQSYELIISNHHILFDGWSTGIILKEFRNAYTDLFNKKVPVMPVKTKFKEFIPRNQSQERKNKEKKFWKEVLQGFDNPRELSIKRRAQQAFGRSGSCRTQVARDIKDELERFARNYGITLASLLYSAWGILLQKYNNTNDVVFGTTVSGRTAQIKGIENMVGLFINTLPMRMKSYLNETAADFLSKINCALQARQYFEMSALVDIKESSAIAANEELFDTVVIIENYPLDRLLNQANGPLSFDSYSIFEMTHYDLTVGITTAEEIAINFSYRQDIFDKDTITRLANHYIDIIKSLVTYPDKNISDLEIISLCEKKRILFVFNNTDAAYPQDKTIHRLFEEQAEKNPDRIAVIGREHRVWCLKNHLEGTRGGAPLPDLMSITYRELNEQSNQLAHLLQAKGVKPGSIVSIMMDRSVRMVKGILASLKAGGIYLPLDPDYPGERKQYMLADSRAKILVTDSWLSEKFKKLSIVNCQLLIVNEMPPNRRRLNNPLQEAIPHLHLSPAPVTSLAYILYTSGSTGIPKGVMVEHRSIFNLLFNLQYNYPFGASDTYLLKTSILFDVSVTELFGWYMGGGRLAILIKDGEKEPKKIIDAIESAGVTHINFVPSQFNVFVDWISQRNINRISGLKYIFLAGEALLPELVNKFRALNEDICLENLYGPTEASVYSSGYSLSQWAGDSSIPIGEPLRNTKLYILDKDDWLQPLGVPGELAISGVGVARGYLNRPELTTEKFVEQVEQVTGAGNRCSWENEKLLRGDVRKAQSAGRKANTRFTLCAKRHAPCASPPGRRRQKIYKTGDLARWLPGGIIEFLGRIDQQVKIRGFRIELGEIENQLLNHEQVKEVVVTARSDKTGDHFLCAYIVPRSRGSFAISSLKAYLLEKLPDYMIPSYFFTLGGIPLTATGKIDRKSLPEPRITSTIKYIAPRNEREEVLADIWSEVLGIDRQRISIDDNFFELGGHSLKAIGLIGRLHKKFNLEMQLAKLLKIPTIRGLSTYISKAPLHIYMEIKPVEEKEYYLLSPAQKRQFILHQMDKGDTNTAYHMTGLMILEGKIEKNKLKVFFRKLINRHESLRTSFKIINETPVQRIHEEVEFEIEYDKVEVDEGVQNFVRPFDLSHAPLLRVGLIKSKDEKHVLMVDMHHIISDGISVEIVVKEFITSLAGKKLPALRLRYRDFSQWQNNPDEKEKESLIKQEKHWLKEFEGKIPVLDLPTDFIRPSQQSFEGNTINFEMSAKDTRALKEYALDKGATLFMVLFAITNIFLSKISNRQDIVMGTPAAGRRHEDLLQVIGMFVNTLALRNYPDEEKTFKEFLGEVRDRTLEAFENQDYQYEDLVEKLALSGKVNRDVSRNPLFDTVFVLQGIDIPGKEIPGLTLKPYEYKRKISKFDLSLLAYEADQNLLFTFEYCTKLFKKKTIERFIGYFKNTVSSVLAASNERILAIEIIPGEEKKQVLFDFNNTQMDYPTGKTIHDLFEEQAARTPDHIAIVGGSLRAGGHRHLSITYKKLNEKANQLAHLLKKKGIKPDTAVAIIIERSVEMIVGMLGILKAGGAYLPIDPGYPGGRIRFILEDSAVQTVIVGEKCSHKLTPDGMINLADVDIFKSPCASKRNPGKVTSVGNLLYIIYTSGSTGKPKGVLVKHSGFVSMVCFHQQIFGEGPGERMSQVAGPGFDAMAFEVWPCLLSGGILFIVDDETRIDSGKMREWLIENEITISFQPTVLAEQLLMEEWPQKGVALRVLRAAGEQLTRYPGPHHPFRLYNLYGPTEDTVWTTWARVKVKTHKTNEKYPPIGKPIANHRVYIVGSGCNIQPLGIPGEMWIAGEGLAQGYLNQPDLTAEKFIEIEVKVKVEEEEELLGQIKNAFSEATNKKGRSKRIYSHMSYIYKTGDLAKWQSDGNIEFLGRIDEQIKIRGFRIEPGEIENQLLKHGEIKDAVVLAKEDDKKEKYLCAYIVTDKVLIISELREFLSTVLPGYMVPSCFVTLKKMPITPNGKIDRRALPEPGINIGEGYSAPGNELEEILVDIWGDVLGITKEKIGIDSNFFQLGGHSLKAAVLTAKVHKELNVKLPLVEVFKNPTIKELSGIIKELAGNTFTSIEQAEEKEYYELSSTQKRMYVVQQMEIESKSYNMPTILWLKGELNYERLTNTFKQLIKRHESLRTSFEMIEGKPVQKILKNVEFEIENDRSLVNSHWSLVSKEYFSSNCQGRGEVSSPVKIGTIIQEFIRPFDLSHAPLMRVGLIKLLPTPTTLRGHPSQQGKKDTYLLMVDMHHIISDGFSHSILVKDFMALYNGRDLPALKIRYRDFARWQKQPVHTANMKKQKKYWLSRFKDGDIPVLDLPTDYPRPSVRNIDEGDLIHHRLEKKLSKKLYGIVNETGSTLFMVLLAAYNILLSIYTNQEDIVVGTLLTGRSHADLENVIGMFVNTLPIRNYPQRNKTFKDFLKEVEESTLSARENQDYSFDELVIALGLQGDSSRNPLFNTVFTLNPFNNDMGTVIKNSHLKFEPYETEIKFAKFDLYFQVTEFNETIDILLRYSTQLFKRSTIREITKYYTEVLEQVVNNIDVKLKDITFSHDLLTVKSTVHSDDDSDFEFQEVLNDNI